MIKNIRFSIGADNESKCVSIAKEYLIKNNYPLIEYGSLAGDGLDWVEVAKKVSRDVQQNKSDFGLLFVIQVQVLLLLQINSKVSELHFVIIRK